MVCVNCQFQDKFPSVVLNKDKEIQIEMGKKEAEVLRLRRRLKARPAAASNTMPLFQ